MSIEYSTPQAARAYRGNPELPNVEPQVVEPGNSTNDTDIIYCIDPDGQAVTLNGTMLNYDGTASNLQGRTINTPKYGRWRNVGPSSGTLYCYQWVDAKNND